MYSEIDGQKLCGAIRYIVKVDGDCYAETIAEDLEEFANMCKFLLMDGDHDDDGARSVLRTWHYGALEVAERIRQQMKDAGAEPEPAAELAAVQS